MSLTNRALFVIERNLHHDLSLAEIAEACKVSRFHLAHAFGEATGRAVMEYVRGRRLTEAARLLASGAQTILTIALEYGYGSHEAFTRAFRSQFERTPEQVRSTGSLEGLALVSPLRLPERAPLPPAEPRIERTGELKFIGLSEPCDYGRTAHIPAQWRRFMQEFYGRIAAKSAAIPAGVSTRLEGQETPAYLCAAEVSRILDVPAGLIALVLPPTTYAVFAHDAHISVLQQTYLWIWDEWFPATGRVPAEAPSLERHNATFDPRTGEGGATIWIAIAD